MTSHLRELIQQLGEAIHESVIESEQIAGVVQDIREHGFDVLLMLEATIGLNEISKVIQPGEGLAEADELDESLPNAFTQNDISFLRSLRISIEGDDKDEDATAGYPLPDCHCVFFQEASPCDSPLLSLWQPCWLRHWWRRRRL